jgi:hypothetical protein
VLEFETALKVDSQLSADFLTHQVRQFAKIPIPGLADLRNSSEICQICQIYHMSLTHVSIAHFEFVLIKLSSP